MIEEIDESLRALLRRDALNGAKVEIAFDAPTKEWAARRNAPTLDLYLYDIREDLERREVAWENVTDDTGRITELRPPPRRFKLSYLVTAWTQRPEDEHRLLSTALKCFLRREALPTDVLTGSLATQSLPVYLMIAQPPPQDRSLSDVWSALGGELKPSLDLVVTAPVPVERSEPAAPPVLEAPKITVITPEMPAPAKRRPSRAEPRRAGPAPVGAQPPALPEETVRGGKETKPGRVLRIRGLPRS